MSEDTFIKTVTLLAFGALVVVVFTCVPIGPTEVDPTPVGVVNSWTLKQESFRGNQMLEVRTNNGTYYIYTVTKVSSETLRAGAKLYRCKDRSLIESPLNVWQYVLEGDVKTQINSGKFVYLRPEQVPPIGKVILKTQNR